MRKHDRTNKPHVVLVTGKTGMGKTTDLLREPELRRASRVVVWDTKGEWARQGFTPVISCIALIATLKANRAGRFALIPASLKWFDLFCRAAFAWGECTVLVEELADVTHPGKAPEAWGMLLRRGRDQGCKLYATTQRPSESDKTISGNVTRVRSYKLGRGRDRKYMADEFDLPLAGLAALKPHDWIEIDDHGRVRRGRTRF